MSDSLRVSLVVWRDASADPPERNRHVWTDVGQAYCWGRKPVWEWTDYDIEADCTPTVWCDPKPPGENALTLNDLRDIAEIVESEARHSDGVMGGVQEWWDLAARLRAAIKAAEQETNRAT